MSTLFRLDHEHDRRNADTGTRSRYGNYLMQRRKTFEEIVTDYGYDDGDLAVPFAAACWRIATGPIMAPPFVISPRRVISARMGRSDWDGEAVVDVELLSELPEPLRLAKTSDGRYFHGWPTDFLGNLTGISGEDLVKRAYLLPRAQVFIRLAPGTLPAITQIPTGPLKPDTDRLLDLAVNYLDVLVRALNKEIGPLLEQMDGRQAGAR